MVAPGPHHLDGTEEDTEVPVREVSMMKLLFRCPDAIREMSLMFKF